jgi:lia operon protein LiaF
MKGCSMMMHKQFSGLTLTVLGTLALLQALGIYYFGLTFWPAVLLWLGLEIVWGSLLNKWKRPSVAGAAVGLLVAGLGLTQILANAGVAAAMSVGELIRYGWPALLVVLGLSLLFKRDRCHWTWNW